MYRTKDTEGTGKTEIHPGNLQIKERRMKTELTSLKDISSHGTFNGRLMRQTELLEGLHNKVVKEIEEIYPAIKQISQNPFITSMYYKLRTSEVFQNMEIIAQSPVSSDDNKSTYKFEVATANLLDEYTEATIRRVQKAVLNGEQKVQVILPLIFESGIEPGFMYCTLKLQLLGELHESKGRSIAFMKPIV